MFVGYWSSILYKKYYTIASLHNRNITDNTHTHIYIYIYIYIYKQTISHEKGLPKNVIQVKWLFDAFITFCFEIDCLLDVTIFLKLFYSYKDIGRSDSPVVGPLRCKSSAYGFQSICYHCLWEFSLRNHHSPIVLIFLPVLRLSKPISQPAIT